MDEKNKSMALLVLGAIAVVAVVGLVMMFVNGNKATGEIIGYGAYPKIYGGAIHRVQYPNYADRGSPYTVTPGDQGIYVGKTQETGYLGTVPPKTYFWEGQGPKSPAQTYGYWYGGGPETLINLPVQTAEWLGSQYRSVRKGGEWVQEKSWNCNRGPNDAYTCTALGSGSI